MPLGIRRTYTSKAFVSDSSAEESDVSSGRSTPVEGNSSSSASRELYHKGRIPSRQFWMAVSTTKLSDLLGFSFKHGRSWAVARISRMMHSEYVFCGFVAPFRGLLFSALHHKLDRRLLSDFAACALSAEPVVRNVALLEALLMMLQNVEVTHELEPLTNYADNHIIPKEKGHDVDPVLAIFLGYIAVHRVRELFKLQQSESETPAELQEIDLENRRSKIRQTIKSALCVPNVAGDVFLELARIYSTVDGEFSFEQVLKTYINRNPEHLTGFLFYLEVLRRRADSEGKLRQLVTMRKVMQLSPADEVVLEYAKIILAFGEIADLCDVASRLAQYLEHWDRRNCAKGWTLLCCVLIYARKYGKVVDIMTHREFWWQYHFVRSDSYGNVDIAKALFIILVEPDGSDLEYVRSVRDEAMKEEDSRFHLALAMLNNVDIFQYERLCDLLK